LKTIKILDLYCGDGLAATGYLSVKELLNCDVEIVGIDRNPACVNSYPGEFIHGNVRDFVSKSFFNEFDIVHASPPCQSFSRLKHFAKHHDNGEELFFIRDFLRSYSGRSILENVVCAPIHKDVVLRGNMFHLLTLKERIFETNNLPFIITPPRSSHFVNKPNYYITVAGGGSKGNHYLLDHVKLNCRELWSLAMGVSHFNKFTAHGLAEGIPPAFTRFILSSILHCL